MKKLFLVLSFIFVTGFLVNGQDIVNYKYLKSYTKEQINEINSLINAQYGMDIYYLEYTTKKLNADRDTASGMFAVPAIKNTKFPILIYEHGTANDRNSVPSKDDNQVLAAVLGSYGYICVFPDYIGLGISKGLHPYLDPKSESWATIDMLKAVKKLKDEKVLNYNNQLFVTGYSQGGHAAMATSRGLQDIQVEVTASAPMSGPYSISKEMKSFTLSDREYRFCGYLGSVFLSAKYVHPDLLAELSVEDAFKPDFAKIVNRFASEEIDLNTMNKAMINLLSKEGEKIIPNRMLKDEVKQKVLEDPEYSLNKALKRMDVCDWKPEFPLKMIYCKADDQVTYRNAVYTDSLMKVNGAKDVSAVDVFSAGNHGSCFNFALLNMLKFFGEYQKIETSSNDNVTLAGNEFYPNPSHGIINFNLPNTFGSKVKVRILNLEGKVVFERIIGTQEKTIDISQIGKGVFFVVLNGNGVTRGKLVVY